MCSEKGETRRISWLPHGWAYRIVEKQKEGQLISSFEDLLPGVQVEVVTRKVLPLAEAEGASKVLPLAEAKGAPLKQKMRNHSYSDTEIDRASEEFCEQLGIEPRHCIETHALLGRNCMMEMSGPDGKALAVKGRITKCWKSLVGKKECHFSVDYDELTRCQVNEALEGTGCSVPAVDDYVHEEMVRVGIEAYREKYPAGTPCDETSAIYKLRVPDREIIEAPPEAVIATRTYVMQYRHYKLTIEAAESTIPGAGLGTTIRADLTDDKIVDETDFTLDYGTLLAIGPYLPMQKEDCQPRVIGRLKDFLYDFVSESWLYPASDNTLDKRNNWDPTDHFGKPRENFLKNPVVFTNEINKGEVPSVHAMRDASGVMQYFVGHIEREKKECRKSLKIPLGVQEEMMVSKSLFAWQCFLFGVFRLVSLFFVNLNALYCTFTLHADGLREWIRAYSGKRRLRAHSEQN